ncbi:MAG: hypothetical protein FWG30_08420 [Eubacteriaceae bacterium]|nr:hypothetical protein [Eubacteriaceae bacterium]
MKAVGIAIRMQLPPLNEMTPEEMAKMLSSGKRRTVFALALIQLSICMNGCSQNSLPNSKEFSLDSYSISLRLDGIEFSSSASELRHIPISINYLNSEYGYGYEFTEENARAQIDSEPKFTTALTVGEKVFYGNASTLSSLQTLEVLVARSDGATMSFRKTVQVGCVYSFAVDCGSMGEGEARVDLRQISESASYNDNILHYLSAMAKSYLFQLNSYESLLQKIYENPRAPSLNICIAEYQLRFLLLKGEISFCDEEAWFAIDTIGAFGDSKATDCNESQNFELNFIAGMFSSALASAVIEQFTGASSVCTASVIAYSYNAGIPLHIASKGNADFETAQLKIPGVLISSIGDAIANGLSAIVPEEPILLNSWEGTGAIVFEPETGYGDFRLSGSVGDAKTIEKLKADSQFIAGRANWAMQFSIASQRYIESVLSRAAALLNTHSESGGLSGLLGNALALDHAQWIAAEIAHAALSSCEAYSEGIDSILEGAVYDSSFLGMIAIYSKPGGLEGANSDFDSLDLSNIEEMQTESGLTRAGDLPDGKHAIVKPGSDEASLSIRNPISERGIIVYYSP